MSAESESTISHQGHKSHHHRRVHHEGRPLRNLVEKVLHPIVVVEDAIFDRVAKVIPNRERVLRPTTEQIVHEATETFRGAVINMVAPGVEPATDIVEHVVGAGSDVRDIWRHAHAASLGPRRARSSEFNYGRIHERAEHAVAAETPGVLEAAVAKRYPKESAEQQAARVTALREGTTRLRGRLERDVEAEIASRPELEATLSERIQAGADAVLEAKKRETEARIAGSAVAQAIETTMTVRDVVEAIVATGTTAAATWALSHAPVLGPVIAAHPGVAGTVVVAVGVVSAAAAGVDIVTGRLSGAQRIEDLTEEYRHVEAQVKQVHEDPLNTSGHFSQRRGKPVQVPQPVTQ